MSAAVVLAHDNTALLGADEYYAGFLTPLFARWAYLLNSQRHKPDQRLLRLQKGEH